MAKFIRYALATFCFAASVGCLALWWRSYEMLDQTYGPAFGTLLVSTHSHRGVASVRCESRDQPVGIGFDIQWHRAHDEFLMLGNEVDSFGLLYQDGVSFPHWYPALIFALAGVAALRLGRRFTLRSAIIATTVVCALLGMAVIL